MYYENQSPHVECLRKPNKSCVGFLCCFLAICFYVSLFFFCFLFFSRVVFDCKIRLHHGDELCYLQKQISVFT